MAESARRRLYGGRLPEPRRLRDDNCHMTTVVRAEGAVLDRILEATHPIWHEGLSRQAYGRYHAAQMRTAWGRDHQQWFALIRGSELLASAKRYHFAGVLEQRLVRICGIGAVFTEPMHRGQGYARALVERLLDEATHEGADLALLFSVMDATWFDRNAFERVSNSASRSRRAMALP
jgi:GNAT superfamily N-acetyltransferase